MLRMTATVLTSLVLAQAAVALEPAHADLHGDPLPDGAVARVGTVRWRQMGGISSVAFSPDGKTLAAGGEVADRGISLWEVATGKELRRCLGHTNGVRSLLFSPDGKKFASAGSDHTIRLWDVASAKELRKFPAKASALAFSPDGKTLARVVARDRPAASKREDELRGGRSETDAIIHLRQVKSGKQIRQLECPLGLVGSIACSPDGKTLATGHLGDEIDRGSFQKKVVVGKAIRLWDIATGKQRGGWGGRAQRPLGRLLAGREDSRFGEPRQDGPPLRRGHGQGTPPARGGRAGRPSSRGVGATRQGHVRRRAIAC